MAFAKESVNLTELPSKRSLTVNLPTEEGGDMITMDKFFTMMKEKLPKNVTWIKLMVGETRISKHRDAGRSVHYFLLNNSPWYIYTVDSQELSHTYHVKTHRGKRLELLACRTSTVFDIKEMIWDVEGIPPDEQILTYTSKKLRNEQFMSVNVPTGATVNLLFRLPGGDTMAGRPFVDVSDASGPQRIEWSSKAPEWRLALPGMCLEGKCTNNNCKASGKMVIINKGFSEFDLINDSHTCECPICHNFVLSVTCGYNNCQWKCIGRKIGDPSKPPQMFNTDWKFVKDCYERFSPQRNGMVNLLDLKMICKKEGKRICVPCGKHVADSVIHTAKCGHIFHSGDCSNNADRNCIECLADNNRTSYQRKFSYRHTLSC